MRHAPRGGLRAGQASRDGLRDDHRPRHDRRRADDRPSARHLHLRGADGLVRRRASGGTRPVLRAHPRGPRVAPGPQRQRRELRGLSPGARDHHRAGAPLLRGGGAADGPPPSAPGAAVPDLGDAQRLARQGAQPAGVRLHRDPWRHRHRRLGRSRRNRHRAHCSPRRLGWAPRRSSWPTCGRAAPRPTALRAPRPSGPTPPWRWPSAAWPHPRTQAVRTRRRCSRSSSGSCARAMCAAGAPAPISGPDDARARCCAPGWPRWRSTPPTPSTRRRCSNCSRRASSATPTSAAGRGASTSASWPRPCTRSWPTPKDDGRRLLGRHATALFDACIPAIPYAAARSSAVRSSS